MAESNVKKTQFHWMVTFHWKEGELSPFQFYLNSVFNDKIPSDWFDGEITDSLRQQQHEISEFPKKIFSFFCRIDFGTLLY